MKERVTEDFILYYDESLEGFVSDSLKKVHERKRVLIDLFGERKKLTN